MNVKSFRKGTSALYGHIFVACHWLLTATQNRQHLSLTWGWKQVTWPDWGICMYFSGKVFFLKYSCHLFQNYITLKIILIFEISKTGFLLINKILLHINNLTNLEVSFSLITFRKYVNGFQDNSALTEIWLLINDMINGRLV